MAQIKISELTQAKTVNDDTVVLIVNNEETQTTSLKTIKDVLLSDINAQIGEVNSVLSTLTTIEEVDN